MRNRYVVLADVLALALAAFGAFLLRFEWFFLSYRPEFWDFLVISIVVKPILFRLFGLYSRYWRYSSMRDIPVILLGASVATIGVDVIVAAFRFAGYIEQLSRVVLLADLILTMLAAGGVRFGIRALGEAADRRKHRRGQPNQRHRRVLVVGAGDAGSTIVREMHRNPQFKTIPVGFLDDDTTKHQKQIHGVLVHGPISMLSEIVNREQVDEVVVAVPHAAGPLIRKVAAECQRLKVRSRAIPSVFELLDARPSVQQLRDIEIADLLRRPQVAIAQGETDYLLDRTVLVTGAGGSIGRELCRQVAHARPRRLVMLGHGENSLFEAREWVHDAFPDVPLTVVIADIRDAKRIGRVFGEFRPSVVFHAAAHKHVPLMEENPEEAVTNNIMGTQVLVDAAARSGTERFVLISTDKSVSPSSVMGASKCMASKIVRRAGRDHECAFVVVRFGNVLGSRGSVVPFFKRQIEQGKPIPVTHPDVRRYFMTIDEAVHLVLQAAGIGKSGDLFVLNMGEPVRIIDLAQDLIRLAGETTDRVPIVVTGLRPGEKLDESLWEEGSVVEPTVFADILRVREPETNPPGSLRGAVEALDAAARDGDIIRVVALLRDWIPSFTPGIGDGSKAAVAPRPGQ